MILLAEHSITVNAPPQKIWDKLVDIDTWPTWDTNIIWARLDRGIETGSSGWLRVRKSPPSPFWVLSVDPGHSYTSATRFAWLKMTFIHSVEGQSSPAKVTFQIQLDGLGERMLEKLVGPMTRRLLPQWMENLKRQLELTL